MAYMNHSSHPFEITWLGQRLVSRWPEIGERLALHRQYRITVEELSSLTDRDLRDLGMDRNSIHDIAREHIYGR